MSNVLLKDRKESTMQYVQTAIHLLKHSTAMCLKMPKRYTFVISTDLVKTAQEIFKDVVHILDTYNNDKLKIQLCERIIARLDYLSSMLNVAYVYAENKITDNQWEVWIGLIVKELGLIKGVKKKLTPGSC